MFFLSARMSHQLFMPATVKSKMSHQLFMLQTVKRQTRLHLPFKINLLLKYLTELNVQIQAFMHKQSMNINVMCTDPGTYTFTQVMKVLLQNLQTK